MFRSLALLWPITPLPEAPRCTKRVHETTMIRGQRYPPEAELRRKQIVDWCEEWALNLLQHMKQLRCDGGPLGVMSRRVV
jgi:hypothetical protein